jgi:hypothetical protein
MEVFETLTYGPFRGAMKCEGQPIQYLAVAIITTELKFNSAEVDLFPVELTDMLCHPTQM